MVLSVVPWSEYLGVPLGPPGVPRVRSYEWRFDIWQYSDLIIDGSAEFAWSASFDFGPFLSES